MLLFLSTFSLYARTARVYGYVVDQDNVGIELANVAATKNVQGDNVQCTKVRKVMIDGILYIVKDGKIFDARGARVE